MFSELRTCSLLNTGVKSSCHSARSLSAILSLGYGSTLHYKFLQVVSKTDIVVFTLLPTYDNTQGKQVSESG